MHELKKLLAFTAAVCLLTGCAADSTGSAASVSTVSSSSSQEQTSASEPTTLTVALDTDIYNMDYEENTDGTTFIVHNICNVGLTDVDADGNILPELAESWDISEDGLTYTFHLADARWSNGEPVTASDFVFGWQRLDDPETASAYAFLLDAMHVKNAAAVHSGEMSLDQLGVKAVDDRTFEVDLEMPCGFFLSLTSFPSFFPLNQAFYESCGDQYALNVDNLLFCGPYQMTEYTVGSQYVFEKNPYYFKADEMEPYVDKIVFRYLQDSQTAMMEYLAGNIDVVKVVGDQVEQYKNEPGFTSRQDSFVWYLALCVSTKVRPENTDMQNLNLRKAISYAIDRETIANNVLKDGSIPAAGFVAMGVSTGPDGNDFRDDAGQLTEYDPEKAQEYYDKAREELGHDVSLEIMMADDDTSKIVGEYVQYNLESLGMTVTLKRVPKKTRAQLQGQMDYQICLTRWAPDYPDPQSTLDVYINYENHTASGSYNNEEFNRLLYAADYGEDANDLEKRWQDYIDAERILVVEDPCAVPIFQIGKTLMINPNVTGIEFHAAGVDSFKHVIKSE